jgi:hypothetical protein
LSPGPEIRRFKGVGEGAKAKDIFLFLRPLRDFVILKYRTNIPGFLGVEHRFSGKN